MHPLLTPRFPIKLAVATGGLWCAWTIAAVFVHAFPNSAPVPATIDPPRPFSVLIRTIPITPELAFADRWQAPAAAAEAMPQAIMAEDDQAKPNQPKQSQISPRRAKRHADRVCGSKGRRYFPHRAASIVAVQAMNRMNGIPGRPPEQARLQLWTIYDGPADYPSNFVARRSIASAAPLSGAWRLDRSMRRRMATGPGRRNRASNLPVLALESARHAPPRPIQLSHLPRLSRGFRDI
jgi:hypothetical protein